MKLTDEGPVFGRGDYGAMYAGDLIELVERHNCVKGCLRSGTAAERAEFGPGGNCGLLAALFAEVAVPEFEPGPKRIVCKVREAPPEPEPVPLPPEMTEPMFEVKP